MVKLTDLRSYLDGLMNHESSFDAAKIDPYMANGMMVSGREEVNRIGFAVSASMALFEMADNMQADALIVHHSFNFPESNRFDSIFQNRISFLTEKKISLFGYHFLLDSHPEVGNNAVILKTLGAGDLKPFYFHGNPWGYYGELSQGKNFTEILDEMKPYLSERMKVYDFGPEKVKRIVAVSGKGAPYAGAMQELIDGKVDLYITGEVHEWNRELFRESGINFIAGGHYHTEKFGIKALMEKVGENFPDIELEWLDLDNEV